MIPLSLSLSLCACSEVGDSDSEDPQVYESMCNIQAQAGSSETTQNSELGNVQFLTSVYGKCLIFVDHSQ